MLFFVQRLIPHIQAVAIFLLVAVLFDKLENIIKLTEDQRTYISSMHLKLK